MMAISVILKEVVKQTPIGAPLRAAWRRIREAAKRRKRSFEEIEAEIARHAMYQFQDFVITGATMPFPQIDKPLVSVILELSEQAELTFRCLRSLKENSHLPIEIVAIAHRSSRFTEKLFERVEGVRYIRGTENQQAMCNTSLGAELARGEYLLLLESTAELTPGSIEASVKAFESNSLLGALGGRSILPDGTLGEAGGFIWQEGICQGYGRGDDPTSGPYMFPRLVDYCSRAFLMTPRSVWLGLGGFDGVFAASPYREADYCMRLWQAGYHVRYEPRATVWKLRFLGPPDHIAPSPTLGEPRERFVDRHAEALRGRPKQGGAPELMMRSRSTAIARKVLICDALLPHVKRGSGFPRANRMVRSLLDLDCEVACLPTVLEVEDWVTVAEDIPLEAEILAHWCYGLELFPRIIAERQGYYDYLIVSRPTTMSFVQPLLAEHPEWFREMQLIYDAEAIFAIRQVSQERLEGKSVSDAELEERVRRELALCAGFEKVLTVSKLEASHFTEHGFSAHIVGHAALIAPGEMAWATRQDVLFIGTILGDDFPNADAVFWFLDQVWPELHRRLPSSRFVIAGINRSQRLNSEPLPDGVVVTGAVDDLTQLYNNARIFVAPSRVASGIPLKVVEAAGMGVPVVATPLLVSQLGWDSPSEILNEECSSGFADACARLYTNERIWQLQREAALARVTAEYSPAVFSEQLRRALDLQTAAD